MRGLDRNRRTLRSLIAWSLLAVVAALPVEGVSWLANRFLESRGLIFGGPVPDGYVAYLNDRDPLLGWPAPTAIASGGFDSRFGRVAPAFSDESEPSCVALFGDSFTWGVDASPEQAYGNVLARLLSCRVSNYGVPGYGTDQAYLRFRDAIRDPAPIVVLGHYVDNIIRNLNQFRGFIGGSAFGFKPRFIIRESGGLELVELPALTLEQYRSIATGAEELLPHDYFRPGEPAGVVVRGFPNVLTSLRVAFQYRIVARVRGTPSYAPFYHPDHPSRALELTTGILEAFVEEARARGQEGIVLLIPDAKDLDEYSARQKTHYSPLVEALLRRGIEALDAAPYLFRQLGDRGSCELYTRCPSGHFTPEGYAHLARAVYERIQTRTEAIAPR